MGWFKELTGFSETNASDLRQKMILDGETLTSTVNGRRLVCGRLETPSLGNLRERARSTQPNGGRLTAREVIADVRDLHADVENTGALFQVASQFNLLEMVAPSVTPEDGISRYENDHTQGPACAVAAGAGTIFRNYFAPVNGQTGQTAHNQIDCLADLGDALGNTDSRLWQMNNGYALATAQGLDEITTRLRAASETERDRLRQLVRIGLQWNTQVTLPNCAHLVTQAYCAALPVAYGSQPTERWEAFARLVLEAAYEATLCAAVLNARATGSQRAYLTLLGGGVFGNQPEWILGALRRALQIFAASNLDISIVSYRQSNAAVQAMLEQLV